MNRFDSPDFLRNHTQSILDFYESVAFDPAGGFFQNFSDDGQVFDAQSRHLVSSTRFVFNYAEAYRRGYGEHYKAWAQHALDYLEQAHFNGETGHYRWQLGPQEDDRAMAYGHAFVMLAASYGIRIGLNNAPEILEKAENILERYFYDAESQLYSDERNGDLSQLSPYRGQNANMHLCEAFIAAFHATGEDRFFARADQLARRMAGDMAAQAGGLIWEHYTTDWKIDWEYNKDKPNDLFKPWGFQPGHQVEWSKLLLQLNEIRADVWYVKRATDLFDAAIAKGWDNEFGGLVYGFGPDGRFSDADKYFWVHAEAFAAAYRLFNITGHEKYKEAYDKIWQWSWQHLIDHEYGAWFRIRTREGQAIDNQKSPMGKVDYHTLGACWDVLDQLER